MWGALLIAVVLGADAGEPAAADRAPLAKLVALPLQVSALPAGSRSLLDELLANAVRGLGQYDVLAKSDIDAMLGHVDADAACDEIACAVEIGGALGAQFLVAGRVAKLGDNLIIVLKLIDTEAHKVVNSIKHKAANDEERYDAILEESVLLLFGLKEPAVEVNDADEALRSRISRKDWLRFQRQRISDSDLMLADWISTQNRESTALFVFEILDAVVVGLAAAILVLQDPEDGYAGPGGLLAVSGLALGGMITLDALDIGGVKVREDTAVP